jgi:hypothetical protein
MNKEYRISKGGTSFIIPCSIFVIQASHIQSLFVCHAVWQMADGGGPARSPQRDT